jgi:endonuclease-3
LTTLEPHKRENERKIIGFLKITEISEGHEKETIVYGDPARSIEIEPSLDIRFWDYYENPNAPDRHVWATGLFRYIGDETVLKFLHDLKRKYIAKILSEDVILQIEKNIQDFEKELPPKGGGKSCLSCGYLNLEQAKFCNRCGKELGKKCTSCQTLNPAGSRYCFECGAQITDNLQPPATLIRDRLLEFGRRELEKPRSWIFTCDTKADKLAQEDSNAFLFAAILDQGIDAERVWAIPLELRNRLGHLDPKKIARMSARKLEKCFGSAPKLHRFWRTMARRIRNGSVLIQEKYGGDAKNIWKDKPESRAVYRRLIEFDGIGQKKASMVTNILFRDLGADLKGPSGIDVSYDEMVRRTFVRTSLVKRDTMRDIINAARSLNPEYPGELDYPAWLIGRKWCLANNPKCNECFLSDVCPKVGI